MNRPLLAILSALTALFAATGTAGAATVTGATSCDEEGRICGISITFTAAPGEANDVFLARDSTGVFVVQDGGANVIAGSGCEQFDAHTARCAPPGGAFGNIGSVEARLGDGNDRIDSESGILAVANGGTGSDRLTVPSVSYSDRSEPVAVDLATGRGGAPGEDDTLIGVQLVVGGEGDDTIRGGANAESLFGEGGSDTLSGGAGGDTLNGGAGVDNFEGGDGSDTLETAEPDASALGDNVSCGAGNDDVGDTGIARRVDPADLLAADCERVDLPTFGTIRQRPVISNTRVVFRLTESCGCRARVTLYVLRGSRRRTKVAEARVADRRRRVAVPLNSAGRRLLRAGEGLATLRVVVRGGGYTIEVER